jgi:hypothetical protein
MMETIFDYNPTPAELKRHGIIEHSDSEIKQGAWTLSEQIDFMKKCFEKSPDDTNWRLGLLFAGRGERKRANSYYAKVKDKRILATLVEDF